MYKLLLNDVSNYDTNYLTGYLNDKIVPEWITWLKERPDIVSVELHSRLL